MARELAGTPLMLKKKLLQAYIQAGYFKTLPRKLQYVLSIVTFDEPD